MKASRLPKTLKRLRRARRMSVATLAERAGYSTRYIEQIERGRPPSPVVVSLLAQALNVPTAALLE